MSKIIITVFVFIGYGTCVYWGFKFIDMVIERIVKNISKKEKKMCNTEHFKQPQISHIRYCGVCGRELLTEEEWDRKHCPHCKAILWTVEGERIEENKE